MQCQQLIDKGLLRLGTAVEMPDFETVKWYVCRRIGAVDACSFAGSVSLEASASAAETLTACKQHGEYRMALVQPVGRTLPAGRFRGRWKRSPTSLVWQTRHQRNVLSWISASKVRPFLAGPEDDPAASRLWGCGRWMRVCVR